MHRGQLLLERGRLLQLMGRAEAAQEEVEAAAALFGAALEAWRASASATAAAEAGAEAGAASAGDSAGLAVPAGTSGLPATARRVATTALAPLLDVAAVLRQLGREERANALLADAMGAAPHLSSIGSYLRAVAQMSEFTGGCWAAPANARSLHCCRLVCGFHWAALIASGWCVALTGKAARLAAAVGRI